MSNPPWGLRSGQRGQDLRPLYQRLGQTYRSNFGDTWRLALLVNAPSVALAHQAGVSRARLLRMSLGDEKGSLVATEWPVEGARRAGSRARTRPQGRGRS